MWDAGAVKEQTITGGVMDFVDTHTHSSGSPGEGAPGRGVPDWDG